MSHGHPGLTPYQAAYLAGGPARVADTATIELIRRGRLAVSPAGLTATGPAEPSGPDPDRLAAEVEQLILGLAGYPDPGGGGGLRLPSLRRRCGSSRPVRQIGARLAAAGLVFSRAQRRLAAGLALVLLAAGVAAGGAIAAGWRAAPTARLPLALVAAVIVAGLLARARQRTTAAGRSELADAAGLARQLTAQLPPLPGPSGGSRPGGSGAGGSGAGGSGPDLSAQDVANVALTGLRAVPDAELRARLTG
jgi:uncharacterized protein (TIGR04222 family)